MTDLLLWFAPVIPLSALVVIFRSIFDGKKQIALGVMTQSFIQPGSMLLLLVVLLWLGTELRGVASSYVVSFALAAGISIFILRRNFTRQVSYSGNLTDISLKGVLSFSIPLVPAAFLGQFRNKLPLLFLGIYASPEVAGLFAAIAATGALVAFGLKAVASIYSALASELEAKEDLNQLERQLQMTARWSTMISVPILFGIVLFGADILGLFNEAFAVGFIALLIVSLGQFINSTAGPVGQTLNMAGYSRLLLINNIVLLVLNLAAYWWLVPRFNLIGAAFVFAVSTVVLNIILILEVRFLLGIRSYSWSLFRPIFAGLLAAAIAWPIIQAMNALPTGVSWCWEGLSLPSFIALAYGNLLSVKIFRSCPQ